ncbi:MAG: class II aldolase/adducin family protein [Myxococcota bacterium]
MKARVLDTARALNRKGLSVARSGNVSARNGDGFFITPSAASYDAITEEDIAEVALDGEPRGGRRSPSSEWRFHADIYRTRPEVGAVVHAHSTCATALACLRRPIPPFHYMVAVAGGRDIRCAPYALFGSQELSDHAVTALAGRSPTSSPSPPRAMKAKPKANHISAFPSRVTRRITGVSQFRSRRRI